MIGQHLKESINKYWEMQTDDEDAFMATCIVCRELGEILKKENFDFEFNPNTYNYSENTNFFNIPIEIGDIDELFVFSYE